MRIDRKVGLALASLACALGVAAWMQPTRDAGDRSHRGVATTQASAPIAVPADIAFDSPKPFAIDAAVARAAVRDGTLRIALPDGRVHAIAIERTYTDETGHWNIVGRAPTRLGAQAMVLTFGANAVFGRIPLPDGGALHVVTAPGDRIVVAPDGGIVPPRFAQVPGQTDVVAPPRDRLATHAPPPTTAPTPGVATTPTIAASKPV
ncbi:MAG: hypothetical protein HOQ01_01860, partial [Lysobacter sp.]|nr:hypothetical protein [Lysobacter sp.]